jgi:hypothetical protein
MSKGEDYCIFGVINYYAITYYGIWQKREAEPK